MELFSPIPSVGDPKELYPALRLHEYPKPQVSFDTETDTDEKKHSTSRGLDAGRDKSQVVCCWKSPPSKQFMSMTTWLISLMVVAALPRGAPAMSLWTWITSHG